MLIIISRDQPGLYESLKPVQERNGTDRVLLERRVDDPRGARDRAWARDRRRQERRAPVSDAERALMRVLGFMVLHREEGAATARRPAGPAGRRGQQARVAQSGAGQRPPATLRRKAS